MPTLTKPISAAACRRIHAIALSDGTITDKVKSDRPVARPGGQAVLFPSVVVATAAALASKGIDPNLASRTLIVTTILKIQGEGDFVAKYLKDVPQPLPTSAKPAKAAPVKPAKSTPAKPVKAATPTKPKAAGKPKATRTRTTAKPRTADVPPPADTGEAEASPVDAAPPAQTPPPPPPATPSVQQEKVQSPEPEPEPEPEPGNEDAPETAETSDRQGVDDTELPAESPVKAGAQTSMNRAEPRRGGGTKAPYVHMIGVVSLLIGAIQLLEANDRNNGYKRRQDTLGALIEDCSQYAQVP